MAETETNFGVARHHACLDVAAVVMWLATG